MIVLSCSGSHVTVVSTFHNTILICCAETNRDKALYFELMRTGKLKKMLHFEDTKRYKLWSCQNVCEALIYLLDTIYIRFGTKL